MRDAARLLGVVSCFDHAEVVVCCNVGAGSDCGLVDTHPAMHDAETQSGTPCGGSPNSAGKLVGPGISSWQIVLGGACEGKVQHNMMWNWQRFRLCAVRGCLPSEQSERNGELVSFVRNNS